MQISDLLAQARTQVPEISVSQLQQRLQTPEQPLVIDVRERDEIDEGYIPDAILIPRGMLEFRLPQQVPAFTQPMVLYCASGNRSLLAAQTLLQLGYQKVFSLQGGINQWVQQGGPLATPQQYPLNQNQKQRYQRQLNLALVGESGQLRLQQSKVLIVGVGGLGSPAALYLAAAGVGTLGLVDADRVALGNLHRQVIHATDKIGQYKVDSARETLFRLNPEVMVQTYAEALSTTNAPLLIQDYDLVIDGSDNFATKYLLNDHCYQYKKPWIYASLYQFDGQMAIFAPHLGHACYRCLLPASPPSDLAPSCMEVGVLGVVPGILGLLQATAALKLILGIEPVGYHQLTLYDALSNRFETFNIQPQVHCPLGHG